MKTCSLRNRSSQCLPCPSPLHSPLRGKDVLKHTNYTMQLMKLFCDKRTFLSVRDVSVRFFIFSLAFSTCLSVSNVSLSLSLYSPLSFPYFHSICLSLSLSHPPLFLTPSLSLFLLFSPCLPFPLSFTPSSSLLSLSTALDFPPKD